MCENANTSASSVFHAYRVHLLSTYETERIVRLRKSHKSQLKTRKPKMEDGPKKIAAAIRKQNGRRRESEKAAAFLRENGETYVRGVYHKRSGWWSAGNVFLGPRSIEARA